MTVDEFFIAEAAINNGQALPADIRDTAESIAIKHSAQARVWIVSMGRDALRPCPCADCSKIPSSPEKTLGQVCSSIHDAFVYGIRYGRLVPEDPKT